MTLDEGTTADQVLTASDPDAEALTFTKVAGPAFMSVTTTNATTGNVHLAPGFTDAGTSGATVRASDGALQSLNVALRSVVTPKPTVVSFATDPLGLTLRIDGTNVTSPANYTVRPTTNDVGDWDIGSFHSIQALETQLVNGVTFTFAGWLPFEEMAFSYMATNKAVQYVASYVASTDDDSGVGLLTATKSMHPKAGGPPPGLPGRCSAEQNRWWAESPGARNWGIRSPR